jgi:hypothetical protein
LIKKKYTQNVATQLGQTYVSLEGLLDSSDWGCGMRRERRERRDDVDVRVRASVRDNETKQSGDIEEAREKRSGKREEGRE